MGERKLARFLGWFSLGLGLTQIAAPRIFTRAFDTRDRTGLVRTVYGLREITVGAAILSQFNPAPWIWTRVAGDVFDLATLGSAYNSDSPKRGNVKFGLASVAGVTVLDVLCGRKLSRG